MPYDNYGFYETSLKILSWRVANPWGSPWHLRTSRRRSWRVTDIERWHQLVVEPTLLKNMSEIGSFPQFSRWTWKKMSFETTTTLVLFFFWGGFKLSMFFFQSRFGPEEFAGVVLRGRDILPLSLIESKDRERDERPIHSELLFGWDWKGMMQIYFKKHN